MLTAFGVILKVKVSILDTYYGLSTSITVQSLNWQLIDVR